MKIEKVEPRGWKFKTSDDTYYIGEYNNNVGNFNPGVIYKNDNAFKTGEGVCYIPEYGFSNSDANGTVLFDWVAKACEAECAENNSYITNDDRGDSCYTKQDFLDLCYGCEEFAMQLYNSVDWQYPETLWDEWMEDDDFFETVKKWCKENGVEFDWYE